MKRLKFDPYLADLILAGTKNTTWRVDDEKDIAVGDVLELCRIDGRPFATAKVWSVRTTTFGALSDTDKDGHEPFQSDVEMYTTYSKYYSKQIVAGTLVKVIKFELL